MTHVLSATPTSEMYPHVRVGLLAKNPAFITTPSTAEFEQPPQPVPVKVSEGRHSLKTVISDDEMFQQGFTWEIPDDRPCRWRHMKTRVCVHRHPHMSNREWSSAKLNGLLRVQMVAMGIASLRTPVTH